MMPKKRPISDDLGLRKPRHSETISHKKCYLDRSTRHQSNGVGGVDYPLLGTFFLSVARGVTRASD